MQSRKGISLVGINDIHVVEKICKKYPEAWFELSYLSTPESLKEVLPIIEGRISSMHLLCPIREYLPNIASKSAYNWSANTILQDAEFAAEHGVKNLILHPGYMIDGLYHTDMKKRAEELEHSCPDQYILVKKGNICKPEYITTPLYREYFNVITEKALILSEKVKKIGPNLLIENLNPRAGYLVMHPDEIVFLADQGLNINLDVGHLYINSFLFGFDFYSEVERILKTDKVKSMHLHSNESNKDTFVDSHKSFDKFIDYKRIIKMALHAGSDMIIESLEEPLHNISLLFED